VVRVIDADFEDALLICLDVVEDSASQEEAVLKLNKILRAFREVVYIHKKESLRNRLGIYF